MDGKLRKKEKLKHENDCRNILAGEGNLRGEKGTMTRLKKVDDNLKRKTWLKTKKKRQKSDKVNLEED